MNTVQEDVEKGKAASTPKARNENAHRAAPNEQVLNAAGILSDVAKEQHPITPTINIRPASVGVDDTPDADSTTAYLCKCPVNACWYHDNPFSLIAQRDVHVRTHYEGEHKCNECNARNGMEGHFISAFCFKIHVRRHHMKGIFKCQICLNSFSGLSFIEHLDECIVHEVEMEASGRARGCSFYSCSHNLIEFPSKQLREQHMMEHLWPSLVYNPTQANPNSPTGF